MHPEVMSFVRCVAQQFPDHCTGRVLECGALNINGSPREIFPDCVEYVGVDVAEGAGVDIVGWVHELPVLQPFDVVVSTEMLEHDPFVERSLRRMYDQLRQGGLLILTCAAPGRAEHGTAKNLPGDSPFLSQSKEHADYFRPLMGTEIGEILSDMTKFESHPYGLDTRVWGLK